MGSRGKAGRQGLKLARRQVSIVCCDTHQKPYLKCKVCGQPAGHNRKTFVPQRWVQ